MYDIVIVGAGPAGLTAAIYSLRAGKKTLIIEKGALGGQMTFSPKIENFPGTLCASGNEIADKMVEQAITLGADIEIAEVVAIESNGDAKKVVTDCGDFDAKAVILATGVKHRMLGLENEEELVGNGISFCAVCDGAFYKDQHVAVIGGGNSAMQEALLLAENCSRVTVVQNLAFLTGEGRLAKALEEKSNVEILYNSTVEAYLCDNGSFKGIAIKNSECGEVTELLCDGVFLAVGLIPENEAFAKIASLDERGYFDSDESCVTVTPGIFVAGDCRRKYVRQVTTAAADGSVAALAACRYIDN